MAVLSNTGIRAGASGATEAEAYTVKRSARFNDDDSAYLNRTVATAGNKKTWTISLWFKRSSFGVEQGVFNSGVSGHPSTFLKIDTNNCLEYGDYQSGYICQIVTNRVFRDPSAWYHLTIAVDTTQATEANRFKLYINGVQETSFSTTNYYSQNDDTDWNNAEEHTLATKSTDELDGYLADIHFIDGTAKAPTDFAETDATTGQWVPKKYDGTYGTNGFHLAMDPANGGTSYSNQLSMTNATAWTASPYGQDAGFNGTIGSGSGGYVQTGGSVTNPNSITFTPTGGIAYSSKVEVYIINNANQVSVNGGTLQSISQDAWVTVASGSGTLTSLKFERAATSGASFSGIRIDDKLLVDHNTIGYDSSGNENHWHENNLFGSEHTTANENFKAIGYEGTGSSGHAINVGFKPGLIWIKERGGSANHKWHDIIRGTNLQLQSNTTDPDETITNQVTSFDTNGFTLGDSNDANQDGEDFVAWCWNAGDTNVTNDASSTGIGTIDSTYRANTTGGFSIVSYTGTGSNGTVAHGLGKAPKFVIVKGRDEDGMAWSVYHDAIGHNGGNNYIELQSDAAAGADNTAFQDTAPTSTVFTIGTKPPVNESGDKKIAYCWAETAGVSKFGSFAGSSSTLTFDCGFAPAYVLIKSHDTAGQEWVIHTKTLGTGELFAHAADAETNARVVNFLPNGFSVNGGQGPVNYSGRNYIFIAFAGNPEGDLDLLVDTPGAPYDNELNGGGNYCTLNPLDTTLGSINNGNLNTGSSGGNAWKLVRGTIGVSSGKWYWEGRKEGTAVSGSNGYHFGVMLTSLPISSGPYQTGCYSVQTTNFYQAGNGTSIPDCENQHHAYALDLDNGTLKFYRNGVLVHTQSNVPAGTYAPFGGSYGGPSVAFNFGQKTFEYTPPSGYKALNTYNLSTPDATIVPSSKAFDIVKWDGAGNTNDVTVSGLELASAPDLIWSKTRNHAYHHALFDVVRGFGANNSINTDETQAEGTASGGRIKSATDTSITWEAGGSSAEWYNSSSKTYVAWNWDAGTANVSKSAGDLNSAYYNTAETWSDALTASSGMGSAEAVFDGSESYTRNTNPGAGSSITFTPASAITSVTKLEILCGANNTGSALFELNGTDKYSDYNTLVGVSNAVPETYVDITSLLGGSTTFTSMKWGYNGNSNYNLIRNIRVNGKVLVDDDVTLTNVPSAATTYRANPNTGFSIVTATGSSSTAYTAAHGLNASPAFIIAKLRETAGNGSNQDWQVYHQSLGNTKGLQLNLNNSVETSSSLWNNTSPKSTVFSIGASSRWDGDFVAYCWSEVAGYSKFGSYTGDTSNYPFAYCGFRPAFVMIKCTSHTGNWGMWDAVRDPDNAVQKRINAHQSAAEYENAVVGLDFLSNGFKIRNSDNDANGSSRTYVFAAFAESPFKYANAR